MRTALSNTELKAIYKKISRQYDLQHAIITFRSDNRGRKLLVEKAVHAGENVLDCGSGTGSTGVMAAKKVGPEGKITMFDLSDSMLSIAKTKVVQEGLQDRVSFRAGDMVKLPFENDTFDVVISTYSLCPLSDPAKGALELMRVVKPGGKIAIAHSSDPDNPSVKWLGEKVEDVAWRIHWLSMGCRSVQVLPTLVEAGCEVIYSKKIGVPLWPFFVFIVEKQAQSN